MDVGIREQWRGGGRLLEEDVEDEPEPGHGEIHPVSEFNHQSQFRGRQRASSMTSSARRAIFEGTATHHCTVSSEVAFLPWKNQRAAMSGPANDATPWKPWLKLRRAAAYLGLPSTEMYEFAATSRHERPHPVYLSNAWSVPSVRSARGG